MKKWVLSTFLSVLCLGLFLSVPFVSLAQVDDPPPDEQVDSFSVGAAQGVPDISFGVPGYPNAQMAVRLVTGSEPFEITGSSTILSFSLFADDSNAGSDVLISCDGVDLSPLYWSQQVWGSMGLSYNGQIHCNSSFLVSNPQDVAPGYYVGVQWLSLDTRLSEASLSDVTVGLNILLVLVFVAFIAFVYNKIERKKPWLR